ncbi:hypothetical protein B0H11DRAFT_2009099 [Mycena galericulata]|nr:hypothetical protein B0H11DRAFT_2009099 [Mycena galericulata]
MYLPVSHVKPALSAYLRHSGIRIHTFSTLLPLFSSPSPLALHTAEKNWEGIGSSGRRHVPEFQKPYACSVAAASSSPGLSRNCQAKLVLLLPGRSWLSRSIRGSRLGASSVMRETKSLVLVYRRSETFGEITILSRLLQPPPFARVQRFSFASGGEGTHRV